ncbi:6-carboxytetrahydropterin synthase QueD [Paramaledivibacter caminithermalis]|jgi:6-pyruvoyltetrahydropterin/6-carboxytetrahydropterin synthase|uniref:6-carboxy-5,6,7,8-tetrahydropterin synthase n=1 Tax=Paramaledivibacter caminithermalis (strain DSM 15212 / CIP 107654 / DViRD3) TaxID=1121301 RepID=A0A1M6QZ91_PARC5|nr:6-carboxytetrahydropterin synthase QueD [Paramaledivibacter caminithermalis]SHK25579.1 6-pyruvoyltetrahydropterin/6-carboxytetrahydropterin synthase [Paramaledivibacter caminithermalis DSM 15212]
MKLKKVVYKEFLFDAAHKLLNYEGDCKFLHGHTYKLIVGIKGKLNEIGMIIDYKEIKEIWDKKIKNSLDHTNLNDSIDVPNTTAEYIASWIFKKWDAEIRLISTNKNELELESITLYETPTSFVVVEKEKV